jgi:hypothetical protein
MQALQYFLHITYILHSGFCVVRLQRLRIKLEIGGHRAKYKRELEYKDVNNVSNNVSKVVNLWTVKEINQIGQGEEQSFGKWGRTFFFCFWAELQDVVIKSSGSSEILTRYFFGQCFCFWRISTSSQQKQSQCNKCKGFSIFFEKKDPKSPHYEDFFGIFHIWTIGPIMAPKCSMIPKLFYFPLWPAAKIG